MKPFQPILAVRHRLLAAVLLVVLAFPAAAQQWLIEPRIAGATGTDGDEFGSSVAVEGDTLLVGAAQRPQGTLSYAGALFLYRRTPGWTQVQEIAADDPQQFAFLGSSVALSGSNVVAGAISAGSTGAAYVFDPQSGAQRFKLVPPDLGSNDRFGTSVDVDGAWIVAGAPYHNVGSALDAGAAYVFDASTGAQLAKLVGSDRAGGDLFGISVAISGTTIVVGAWGHDQPGNNHGAAYVFDVTTLQETQKLVPSDGAVTDLFGRSVAIDGDRMLVCSKDAGYVFVRQGVTWVEEARLASPGWPDGETAEMVGAIDGDRVVLGLQGDDELGASAGSAVLFSRSGGTWVFEQRVLGAGIDEADRFGGALGLSDTLAVIGARYAADDAGLVSGMAFAFERSPHATFCNGPALNACPCNNVGTLDSGCDNPQGTGGVRAEFFSVDRNAGTALLVATGFPPNGEPAAIVIRSPALEPVPQPFFDGARCIATAGLVRMAATSATGGVARHAIVHAAGSGSFHYQVWYRSAPAFCTSAPSNVSSGDSMTW